MHRYITSKPSEAIPQKILSECFCFSRCKVDVIHYGNAPKETLFYLEERKIC